MDTPRSFTEASSNSLACVMSQLSGEFRGFLLDVVSTCVKQCGDAFLRNEKQLGWWNEPGRGDGNHKPHPLRRLELRHIGIRTFAATTTFLGASESPTGRPCDVRSIGPRFSTEDI